MVTVVSPWGRTPRISGEYSAFPFKNNNNSSLTSSQQNAATGDLCPKPHGHNHQPSLDALTCAGRRAGGPSWSPEQQQCQPSAPWSRTPCSSQGQGERADSLVVPAANLVGSAPGGIMISCSSSPGAQRKHGSEANFIKQKSFFHSNSRAEQSFLAAFRLHLCPGAKLCLGHA